MQWSKISVHHLSFQIHRMVIANILARYYHISGFLCILYFAVFAWVQKFENLNVHLTENVEWPLQFCVNALQTGGSTMQEVSLQANRSHYMSPKWFCQQQRTG